MSKTSPSPSIPVFLLALILPALVAAGASAQDPNDPGILEPVLSAVNGFDVRVPNTDQAANGDLLNASGVERLSAYSTTSLLGEPIFDTRSPESALLGATLLLKVAAFFGDGNGIALAAQELENILLGTTQGRIYDGFAQLRFNRGGFVPDHVPGEHKMKVLRDSGLTELGLSESGDLVERKVWEVDVNLLYSRNRIDSDTFLLRVPVDVDPLDHCRIHYRVYFSDDGNFAPTVLLRDHRQPGSVHVLHKGYDSVWLEGEDGEVLEVTVDGGPVRHLRAVMVSDREAATRTQLLQPIFEMVDVRDGQVILEPRGESYAQRNRLLTLDDIGGAAPEKKLFEVARAALEGAPPAQILSWLGDPQDGPRGTWAEWIGLLYDTHQLPPEAWDVLANEGLEPGDFGPYRMVTVYLNNTMYGAGPEGASIEAWSQGDSFQIKLINLDAHRHYFRGLDAGPRLHDDISTCCDGGEESLEIFDYKALYGVPKGSEVQWRVGWGFRPPASVIRQPDVFSRPEDQMLLKSYTGAFGAGERLGYQYSAAARGGDFRFAIPIPVPFQEEDGSPGLIIGQTTEGFGVAKMCSHEDFPLPSPCLRDLSPFSPTGQKNIDVNGDGVPDVLFFVPPLRNPNPTAGGDIIPPTSQFQVFQWINPNNGTLLIDPNDPGAGYWSDLTYAHGRPVEAGTGLTATIEAPRASGQLFLQFDALFSDSGVFAAATE